MATEAQGIARAPGGMIRCTVALSLPVTATANTDYTFVLPGAARNVAFRTKTTTAYGAATDAQISIGKTVGGAEYVAATTIKALGDYSHTLVGTNIADLDSVPGALGALTAFNVRVAQTGTASATGAATLYAEYSMPG